MPLIRRWKHSCGRCFVSKRPTCACLKQVVESVSATVGIFLSSLLHQWIYRCTPVQNNRTVAHHQELEYDSSQKCKTDQTVCLVKNQVKIGTCSNGYSSQTQKKWHSHGGAWRKVRGSLRALSYIQFSSYGFHGHIINKPAFLLMDLKRNYARFEIHILIVCLYCDIIILLRLFYTELFCCWPVHLLGFCLKGPFYAYFQDHICICCLHCDMFTCFNIPTGLYRNSLWRELWDFSLCRPFECSETYNNVWTKLYGHPSDSYWDVSVWSKAMDHSMVKGSRTEHITV